MSIHPLLLSAVLISCIFIYISVCLWKMRYYERYKPTQEEIDHEIKLMSLEKEHFGHITLYDFRESKEYKAWLKKQVYK